MEWCLPLMISRQALWICVVSNLLFPLAIPRSKDERFVSPLSDSSDKEIVDVTCPKPNGPTERLYHAAILTQKYWLVNLANDSPQIFFA